MSQQQQRIGDLLVANKLIKRAVAESAAVQTVLQDTRIVSVLIRGGKVDETEALKVLSEQVGAPGVQLARVIVSAQTLERLPATFARLHTIFPLSIEDSTIHVAMASPQDDKIVDEIAFATGLQVLPYVGLHFRIKEAVGRAYAGELEDYYGPDADSTVEPSESELPVVTLAAQTAASDSTEGSDAPEATEIAADASDDPGSAEIADVSQALESAEITELADGSDALESSQVVDAPTQAADPMAGVDALLASVPTPVRKKGQQEAETPSKKHQHTILLVDDEPEIMTLLVDTLKPLGHKMVTASRGVQALQLLRSSPPDLVILDAMLPEVHGFEICRKIKESKRFGRTPVLMISAIYRGWRIAEDIKTLYKADAFLEKPFRIGELRMLAERLLAKAPARAEDDPTDDNAKNAYEASVEAYKDEDFDAAFTHLRRAESLEPFSAKIQFMLGRVLEQQERVFQAIYHYERAVELNPQLFPAAKNLALLYQTKGFKNKAVEMWERSLRAAPTQDVREQIKKHLVSIL